MNGIFMGNDPKQVTRVFGGGRMEQVRAAFSMAEEIITKKNLKAHSSVCKEAEIAFSTWGMPSLSQKEIREYLPNLKAVFYAAGSVQDFARPFLDCGVRVFSAWGANAVPVADYVFAQIALANKGFFGALRKTSLSRGAACRHFGDHPGNFEAVVGLVGAGMIGGMVAERCKTLNVKVLAFDPFLSDERARELQVTKVTLLELFEQSDVISNHLANNEKTKGMLNYECFSRMKPYAVFLNTGRGAQVVERDLVKAMKRVKTRAAVLDVTLPEPPRPWSPLNFRSNIFLTPHIAGSSGNEIWRMADYMIEQAERYMRGETTAYEVTPAMLDTMA